MAPHPDDPPSPAAGPWRDRQTVAGTYHLRGLLGAGGMSYVYLAHDTHHDRPAAIKVPKNRYRLDEQWRQNFTREARLWSGLVHPHIVQVYGVADDLTTGHIPAIFMQYCDGGSLAARIHGGHLPLAEALDLAVQICWAISYAHSRNCLHRDLKPLNVLLDRQGRAYVTDFGLALEMPVRKRRPAGSRATSRARTVGGVAGTPSHLAPEQWRQGARPDPRSDVYSFGVLLFEMLCGQLPLQGQSWKEWRQAHRHGVPLDPCRLNPQVPASLGSLVLACLAKSAADRPASFAQLAEGLIDVYRQTTGKEFPRAAPLVPDPSSDHLGNQGETLMALGLSSERRGHYQEAKGNYTEACEFFKSAGNEAALAQCHVNLGTAYLRLGDLDSAEQQYRWALALAPAVDQSRFGVAVHLGLGAVHQERGHYAQAEQLYRQALAESEAAHDRVGEVDGYRNLGTVQSLRGDFAAADDSLRKAAAIAESLGWKASQAASYLNLGANFLRQENHAAAIDVLQRARVMFAEEGSRTELAACCMNLARAYEHLGEQDKAVDLFDDALHEYVVLGDVSAAMSCFQQLLARYAEWKDDEAAARLLEKTRPLFRAQGARELLLFCCLSLGDLYARQRKTKPSIAAFEEALDQAEFLGNNSMVMHCFLRLTALYLNRQRKDRLFQRVQAKLGHEGMMKHAVQLVVSLQHGQFPGVGGDLS